MKKNIFLISTILFGYSSFCQKVGIGTTTPAEKLTVLSGTNAFGLLHTDGTIGVGTWVGNGGGYIGTKSVHPLRFFTANGITQMTLLTNGNVGIGTLSPTSKLTIQTPNNSDGFTHISDGGIIVKDVVGGISAGFGTYSPHIFRLVANSVAAINIDINGSVGVGVSDPLYKMDIADRIRIRSSSASSTAGIALNNYNNSAVISFIGTKDLDLTGIYGNVSGWGLLMNTNTGDVSVGSQNPVAGYKLSVQGNQYVNGLINSTGDAEIGKNLQIGGITYANGGTTKFFANAIAYNVFPFYDADEKTNTNEVCSIIANYGVAGTQFIAFSDARIKDIAGKSNSAKDLQTINALQITDYTMKDKANFGNKAFKKVIAQEVEKVYPQVVAKQTGYIPNVYQLTETIKKTDQGYLLHFAKKHNISTAAKKIRIQLKDDDAMREFKIVSIGSENEVEIVAGDFTSDKLFVYGEQVNDFRSVDYEGLTTLNISATQELSKLIEAQNKKIDALTEEIKMLKAQKLTASQ